MTPPRIAVLSNPGSGFNRRRGLDAVDDTARQAGIVHYKATGPDDIRTALQTIALDPPAILAVNGGDGTVDLVVQMMRTEKIFALEPALALLRGGTTNMIHIDCGLPGRPAGALRALMHGRGTVHERHPLQIVRDGQPDLYGFFLGTGALPRAILSARRTFHKRGLTGRIGETLAIAAIILRLKLRRRLEADAVLHPSPLSWQIDDHDLSGPHIFMALTSLRRLIGNRRLKAPDGSAGILYMGSDRKLRTLSGQAVAFQTGEEWMLDGERFPPGDMRVSLGAPLHFILRRAP